MGGEVKQYQVVVDAKRLAAYRLALGDIERILERNNASIGGGYIEKNRESFVIRGDAQFRTLEDIENTVVTSDDDGTPVLIKNVAQVQIGPALRFGAVTKHGEGEIVAGTVMMLTGANSREVVTAVKARLAEIQARAAGGRGDPLVLRPRRVHRPHAAHGGDQPRRGRGAGGGDPVPDARQPARLADRGAGDPAGDGDRGHRHGAPRRHRQPDVARRDRLRAAGRRRDRHARSGAAAAGARAARRELERAEADRAGDAPGRRGRSRSRWRSSCWSTCR